MIERKRVCVKSSFYLWNLSFLASNTACSLTPAPIFFFTVKRVCQQPSYKNSAYVTFRQNPLPPDQWFTRIYNKGMIFRAKL